MLLLLLLLLFIFSCFSPALLLLLDRQVVLQRWRGPTLETNPHPYPVAAPLQQRQQQEHRVDGGCHEQAAVCRVSRVWRCGGVEEEQQAAAEGGSACHMILEGQHLWGWGWYSMELEGDRTQVIVTAWASGCSSPWLK